MFSLFPALEIEKGNRVKHNSVFFPYFSFTKNQVIIDTERMKFTYELTSQKQNLKELQIHAETRFNLYLHRIKRR